MFDLQIKLMHELQHKLLLSITGDIVFFAGNVQNTFLVPAEKFTKLSLLDDDIIVSLDKVSGAASVTVPIPTSNSPAEFNSIA